MRSVDAQLAQWMAEKVGQESGLSRVRERVGQIDHDMQGLQQRFTEAQLVAQEIRTTREHRRRELQRIQQQQQDGITARIDTLTRHVEGLTASIEQSRLEREGQEARCRAFGESAVQTKAQLVELQEAQARDMAAAHQIDIRLEDVRRTVSALRESRMTVEVKKAELRMQLGTVESTLVGTYQVDLATLLGCTGRGAEISDQLALGAGADSGRAADSR